MDDLYSEADLTARRESAVAAAATAGRDLGLTVAEPKVLYDAFSVVVHLAPAPVVARVPTVTPVAETPERHQQRQRDELAVAGWLHGRGEPVVPPSPLVPAEPVRRNGFAMTFWQLVEPLDAEPDYVGNSADVARLHAVLREYPKPLPFWSPMDNLRPGLEALAKRPDLAEPADLDRAWREWELLEPLVTGRSGFEARFGATVQPIHGDVPAFNLIETRDGKLFSDFECVTIGPAEWDLGMAGPDGRAAYDAAADHHGLRRLDPEVVRVVDALGMLQGFTALSLVPQLPMLADALRPLLDQWRATPFTAVDPQ